MSNVHYLSTVYPDLQWSADTDQDHDEAARWLSGLDNLFNGEELNLSAGEPQEGTLPGRLASREFWHEASGCAAAPGYSPAARYYLENCLAMEGFSAFEEYLHVWARVFYTVRMDAISTRDVLLLFLQQS